MTATSPAGTFSDVTFAPDAAALDDTWVTVGDRVEVVDTWLSVAGATVHIRAGGPALAAALLPALGHLVVAAPSAAADLEIRAWDSTTSGTTLPPLAMLPAPGDPPAPTSHAFGDGALWLQPVDAVLSALRGSTAWWCVPDVAGIAAAERAAPFKAIFHWWLAARGLHLVHAGAIGLPDGSAGAMLPGPGGAGKSTTVARCARAGLRVGGDDFVIVGTDPPRVHPLYRSVKVSATVAAEPGWPPRRLPDCGEKATLLLDEAGGTLGDLPLDVVALPRVEGGAATTSTPARGAEVVMALAPWTLLQLPIPRKEAFDAARAIATGVPAVHLRLGSDPDGVVAAVRMLLGGR